MNLTKDTKATKDVLFNGKVVYIEALRIFSAFLVIFNHTEIDGFFLFSTRSVGSVLYWVELFLAVFCKCAVFVFFAISGALLLNREPEGLKVYIRRILRILVILVLISLVYYLALIIPVGNSFDLKAFLTMMFTCEIDKRLWFLYTYLAFLVVLPFLQIIAGALTDKLMFINVIVVIVFGSVVPCLQYFFFQGSYEMTGYFSPFITSPIFLYPLLGHYLHNCNLERARKNLPLLWVVNILTIMCAGIMVTYQSVVNGILTEKDSQQFIESFVVINVITVWDTFRILFANLEKKTVMRLITVLGSGTLGIYLLHPLILEQKWLEHIREVLINMGCPKMLACFIWVMITFIIAAIITVTYKKIIRTLFRRA